jgi:hypothetical protein
MAYTNIKQPNLYFNTKLYTGNGSTQSITGVGFQPDFIWNKQRNGTNSHYLFNAIIGTGKFLKSNSTDTEGTNTDTVTSFDSDGFTLGSAAGNNGSGNTMASWNWLASNTTASNTVGDINSTVSVNTTSGFSIVSYTGTGSNATVGHGLGVTPKMMIVKQRTGTENWTVYHVSIGNPAQYMELNSTGAVLTNSLVWNSNNPTSSVFSVGTNARTNNNTSTYIAYCFAEKQGFSKFGSYIGNGNADGTFVYTGFKPAFVMTKRSNNTENWYMLDNERSPFNPPLNALAANLSNAEDTNATGRIQDFLSNGFKLRTSDTAVNGSGDTYIYMAFAEEPLVGDNPATAR